MLYCVRLSGADRCWDSDIAPNLGLHSQVCSPVGRVASRCPQDQDATPQGEVAVDVAVVDTELVAVVVAVEVGFVVLEVVGVVVPKDGSRWRSGK